MPLVGADRGVEHDDAVIAIAVGDIDFVGLLVDRGLGGLAELRGVVAALARRDLADLHHEFAVEGEFQDARCRCRRCRRSRRSPCRRPRCRVRGRPIRSLRRGRPSQRSRLPSLSNSSTGGAGTQHFERGGVNAAPFSSSVSERGRWMTQMWPCASTVMPPTWPRIQLFGSVFGHDGSTAKVGISPACAVRESPGEPINRAAAMYVETALERLARAGIERARGCIGVMAFSRIFLLRIFPIDGE